MKIRLGKKYYVSMIVLPALFLLYARFVYSPVIFKVLDRYSEFNPTGVPEGLASLSSEECKKCHTEIYREWKTSMHANAYTDPYFQAYFKKDGNLWVCLYCHTPLEKQLEFTVSGFVRGNIARPILDVNEGLDAGLREEGVTCAACHVVEGVIHGPYEDAKAPHPTKYDERFKSVDICRVCHEVPAGGLMFYKTNPCGSVEEFNAGPYKAKNYTCQRCHMPEIMRPLTNTSKRFRKTGRHFFPGGHSKEMLEKALYIELVKKGDKFELSVLNNGAGHKFPTGDPDRYVVIRTRFFDEQNSLIREETEKLRRLILYKPVIIEFSDSRLGPLIERMYSYDDGDALKKTKYATVTVEYHILSDRAKRKLVKKYGLPEGTVKMYELAPKRFYF